jgi:hypothetical protein
MTVSISESPSDSGVLPGASAPADWSMKNGTPSVDAAVPCTTISSVLTIVAKLPAGPGQSFAVLPPSEMAMNTPERRKSSGKLPLPSNTSTRETGKASGENVHVEAAFASAGVAVIATPPMMAASARRLTGSWWL